MTREEGTDQSNAQVRTCADRSGAHLETWASAHGGPAIADRPGAVATAGGLQAATGRAAVARAGGLTGWSLRSRRSPGRADGPRPPRSLGHPRRDASSGRRQGGGRDRGLSLLPELVDGRVARCPRPRPATLDLGLSEKLRKVRITTIPPRSPTLSTVSGAAPQSRARWHACRAVDARSLHVNSNLDGGPHPGSEVGHRGYWHPGRGIESGTSVPAVRLGTRRTPGAVERRHRRGSVP